ncbi:UreF-domain-containing protein [Annulohypoxylon truncatum]|uniref:UreF-domain-containing protein n=1 Tax=Annulohypoxylon truncatum TaxID=327061 RepID=UPI0020085343|nr:UreF-domain-containing protein [Annulohypoxylon truncatum]KAI1214999.1 UreF-domain-containing protein [Annulohypoxylon truncatum]
MMNSTTDEGSREVLENEIADLELRLRRAKERLAKSETATISPSPSAQSAHHYLLLLSDSALPLGSFAFSSGLESYLAHTRRARASSSYSSSSLSSSSSSSFSSFLPLSLSSYASSTLPFALAAHRDPQPDNVAALDDALDAAIVCTVGRRASVAQGRALLSIWEKSVAATADPGARLRPFAEMLRSSSFSSSSFNHNSANGSGSGKGSRTDGPPLVSAHLAPLFGAVAALCGLSLRQTAYVFMLSHVKALVSAAVRAGQFGPYQAQRILASAEVQAYLEAAIEREWRTPIERAGQSVPVMDLWVGRHELLYSRIFNS